MRKHETAVCRTARTVVWEVGKREVGGKHFYQRLPPTRLKSPFYGILSMILEYDIASIVNKCRQMMQQQAIMSDN